MNLLKDEEAYKEFIESTSAEIGLADMQIEKDYMVSLLLKRLAIIDSLAIVFKGGTSLSKCYDVINRFSEDIDIAVEFTTDKFDVMSRRLLKKEVINAINDAGFQLLNPDDIRARRGFNKYIVKFPKVFKDVASTDSNIIVETIVVYKPYPCETKLVSNYITKFLEKTGNSALITKYNLEPFEMKV